MVRERSLRRGEGRRTLGCLVTHQDKLPCSYVCGNVQGIRGPRRVPVPVVKRDKGRELGVGRYVCRTGRVTPISRRVYGSRPVK